MAKYKVLKKFKNLETGEIYESGQEVELTVKRADEAIKNLKEWDGEFLERITDKDEEAERIAKEAAEVLKVAEEEAAAAELKAKEEAEAKVKEGK